MMFVFIDLKKIKISIYVNVLGRKQVRLFLNENKAHEFFLHVLQLSPYSI